jgi:GT2 family glycosyltransferase
MTPVISVIMPVRNGNEKWLREAIASVLAQDFADFEVLIVNDGSAPNTVALLDQLANTDARIRVIHQTPQGIVAALNRAVAEAHAPYLARLDGDDRAKPRRLSRQLAFMQAHPETVLLGTFAERIDHAGNVIGRLAPPTDGARLLRILDRTNPFIHSSTMMRGAVVRKLGGYRPAFRAAEDYDLWLRMAEAGGVAVLPETLVQYRVHDTNLSRLDATRQSFSVRLAQRSAAARRRGAGDPASALTSPPDWWANDAETAFYSADAAFYRFLDADRQGAPPNLSAAERRLLALTHVERKLAQSRLSGMLHEGRAPLGRHLRILLLLTLLHPGRAAKMAWRKQS